MRHSREQIEATMKAWQDSGLSKKTFCRNHNISYGTFQYWSKRLQIDASGFTEVTVASQGSCELIFPSGVRLVFHEQPSVGWLRDLVG